MKRNINISRLLTQVVFGLIIIFFIAIYIQGNFIVGKQEKEFNFQNITGEAKANKYSLKELDAKTGELRWKLIANEGSTHDSLKAATISDVQAEIYKNNEIIFTLTSPFAKANASKKEVYLYGDVTCQDKKGNFLLKTKRIDLKRGTTLLAQNGFNILLGKNDNITGEVASVNENGTTIKVKKLKEAVFKDIILLGENVLIKRNETGDLIKAVITGGGKIILKNSNNDSLSADTIKWHANQNIEAVSNVIYLSQNKTFKAGYLLITPDGKIQAKNNVVISDGSTTCYGNLFNIENKSLVTISGRPKVIQKGKRISADKIVYDLNTGKVEAIGNVQTIVDYKV